VPEPDRARIRGLADGVMHRDEGLADVPASAMQASADLMVYYADMVAQRRKKPSDDLTSALLEAEMDGDRLTDDEIMAFLFLMVVAGNETTTKLLANAAYWGAKNPDQLAPVFDDHSRIPLWVEETLRYDNSSQILARTVSGELTLYDTTLPDGDVLLLLPGSANRDDRVFEDADEYRIGREIGSKLVSFGSGAHFCLGAHLARMEARVALTELFKRIRGYEVDEANAVRVHSSNVRGFAHLPIAVTVR
jgi:cytochrome P450